jgi:transposase
MLSLPLSDDAWGRVSHLLAHDSRPRFGRPTRDPRDILNAILWVITQNEKWHRLPASFPPSQTCYIKWMQWRRAGIMSTIIEELGVMEGPPPDPTSTNRT